MSAASSSTGKTQQPSYFSDNYLEASHRIKESAASYHGDILTESLPIAAKGYNGEDLSVHMVWIGPKDSTNIIIHISGTHGVEGFAGSAIQLSLLQNPIELPENTSMIIIHALNPFGMAHFRRVTENNIDLNRNFSTDRTSPPTYEKIDSLMNPKEFASVDFFTFRFFLEVVFGEGWEAVKNTLANGQYDFEEGLFYGGREVEEAPKRVFEWFETHLTAKPENIRITIIDVHTGLGSYAEDTLLTVEPPTEEMKSFFGKKISAHAQDETTGYRPTGMFVEALRDLICGVTNCTKDKITVIGQEFGTVSVFKVLNALRDENTLHHIAKRNGEVLDPSSPARQDLLKVFYPKDPKWKHLVLARGRELVKQAAKLVLQSTSL